eukprot:COSAG05_NODE_102_length_19076_cov_21.766612_4_plen_70_part_00
MQELGQGSGNSILQIRTGAIKGEGRGTRAMHSVCQIIPQICASNTVCDQYSVRGDGGSMRVSRRRVADK